MVAQDRIPHRALLVLVPAMVFETGILRLPGNIIADAGYWGWLAALIISLLAALNMVLIFIVMRMNRFMELPRLMELLMGHWLARMALGFVGVAVLMRGARIARVSTELITQELLPHTPLWVVLVAGFPVLLYVVWHGVEVIARFIALVFPFYYAFFLLVFLLVFLRADPGPLLVLTDWNPEGIVRAVLTGIADFQGYGMILLILPWVWRAERSLPYILGGWVLLAFVSMLIIFGMITALGTSGATATWSTLELVDLVSFPGLFIERMESVFFMIWLFLAAITLMLTVFGAAYVLAIAFTGRPLFKPFVIIVAAVKSAIALMPPTLTVVDMASEQIRVLGWIDISLPLVLLMLTLIRRRPSRLGSQS